MLDTQLQERAKRKAWLHLERFNCGRGKSRQDRLILVQKVDLPTFSHPPVLSAIMDPFSPEGGEHTCKKSI